MNRSSDFWDALAPHHSAIENSCLDLPSIARTARMVAVLVLVLVLALVLPGIATRAEQFALFKSTDAGRSWNRSDAGLPGQVRINALESAAGSLVAGTDAGIFLSTNDALAWQPAVQATATSPRVIALAAAGRRVFAGTDRSGILVSADGGASWVPDPSFPSRKILSLLAHDGRIYVGTDAEGVWVSDDLGRRWAPLGPGLPAPAQVFALARIRKRLFAALYRHGLYAWEEQKPGWSKVGPVHPLALASVRGTLIAGHNPGGLHASADLGATWFRGTAEMASRPPWVSDPDVQNPFGAPDELTAEAPVWALGSDDHLVFAGASAGVFSSRNQGRTWARTRGGLPNESPGIAFLVRPALVFAVVILPQANREPSGASLSSPAPP